MPAPIVKESRYGYELINEIDELRMQAAVLCRDERNNASMRAFMENSKLVRTMYGAVYTVWHEAVRDIGAEASLEEIEAHYSLKLANWFENHYETAVAASGEFFDEPRGELPTDTDVVALGAFRHSERIRPFVEKYAGLLRDRAAELAPASVGLVP